MQLNHNLHVLAALLTFAGSGELTKAANRVQR
jgi:hypothetical protein